MAEFNVHVKPTQAKEKPSNSSQPRSRSSSKASKASRTYKFLKALRAAKIPKGSKSQLFAKPLRWLPDWACLQIPPQAEADFRQ